MILKRVKNRICTDNRGSTLVEMVVCFALLGIFLAASAAVISMITGLFFEVKGETYAEQVSDILMEKISSEIDGALYLPGDASNNPRIDHDIMNNYGSSISVIDKTNTSVTVSVKNNQLVLDYDAIVDSVDPSNNRNKTTWRYDSAVYNGFSITDFKLIRGDGISSHSDDVQAYGIDGALNGYGSNVILVLLELNSPKYGTYKSYRFVKMYNAPESAPTNPGA